MEAVSFVNTLIKSSKSLTRTVNGRQTMHGRHLFEVLDLCVSIEEDILTQNNNRNKYSEERMKSII